MKYRMGAWAACTALVPGFAQAQTEPNEPVAFGATYVTDVIANIDGGKQRGLVWLGRADLTLTVDGALFGWNGGEAMIDVLAVQQPDFSGRYVGDAQVVSNVQGDSAVRPIEAWIASPIAQNVSIKFGMVDLNSEFDVQTVGAHFINSSHGIGPDFSQSGVNGPSIFPAGATAVLVRYRAGEWTLRAGVFDAVAGSTRNPRRAAFRIPGVKGALLVAEVERSLPGEGKIQAGAWRYTPRFASIDPASSRDGVSQGAYVMVEGPLTPKVDAWMRAGVASPRVNEIGVYLGGGVTVGDEARRIGLAVAQARLGDTARRVARSAGEGVDLAETIVELSYSHRISSLLTVQPDVQYVINPGWEPSRKNALVTGLRLTFAWTD